MIKVSAGVVGPVAPVGYRATHLLKHLDSLPQPAGPWLLPLKRLGGLCVAGESHRGVQRGVPQQLTCPQRHSEQTCVGRRGGEGNS